MSSEASGQEQSKAPLCLPVIYDVMLEFSMLNIDEGQAMLTVILDPERYSSKLYFESLAQEVDTLIRELGA